MQAPGNYYIRPGKGRKARGFGRKVSLLNRRNHRQRTANQEGQTTNDGRPAQSPRACENHKRDGTDENTNERWEECGLNEAFYVAQCRLKFPERHRIVGRPFDGCHGHDYDTREIEIHKDPFAISCRGLDRGTRWLIDVSCRHFCALVLPVRLPIPRSRQGPFCEPRPAS